MEEIKISCMITATLILHVMFLETLKFSCFNSKIMEQVGALYFFLAFKGTRWSKQVVMYVLFLSRSFFVGSCCYFLKSRRLLEEASRRRGRRRGEKSWMNNEEEYTKYTATNKSSLATWSNKITSLGIHLLDHIHYYFPELFIQLIYLRISLKAILSLDLNLSL